MLSTGSIPHASLTLWLRLAHLLAQKSCLIGTFAIAPLDSTVLACLTDKLAELIVLARHGWPINQRKSRCQTANNEKESSRRVKVCKKKLTPCPVKDSKKKLCGQKVKHVSISALVCSLHVQFTWFTHTTVEFRDN